MKNETSTPQVGDLAWHKKGYDPRTITRIEGPWIGLDILGTETWPCPIENYFFTRSSLITDHLFVGVEGHEGDDECTYREDGTDDTYCGQWESAHENTTRD